MNALFDKLNLSVQERRFVVLIGLVVFVVLNLWLVTPHFHDLTTIRNDTAMSAKQLEVWRARVRTLPNRQAELRRLENQGSSIVPEDLQLDLIRSIQSQAMLNKLALSGLSPAKTSAAGTNQFFEEREVRMDTTATPEDLMNFMISLASTNSLIRVRDFELGRDPTGSKLSGRLNLVASYQRKPATPSPSAASARTNATPAPARRSPPANH